MKKHIIKLTYILTVFATLFLVSCEDLLDENPKSSTTPDLYNSASGVFGGLTGVYSNLRNFWGTEAFHVLMNAGTDETKAGGSASALTYYTYNGMDVNGSAPLWTNAYQSINTLNGVIQQAAIVDGLTTAQRRLYAGHARFLRALLYYYLVTNFGDVPLNLEFITVQTTEDYRDPIADVYDAIITDLDSARVILPASPASPFAGKPASLGAATYLLSKVYLTRGWSTAAEPGDFVQAYTLAEDMINNKGTYGVSLLNDYADVNKDGNDYNSEVLFAVDYNNDVKYGEWVAQASGGKPNLLNVFFRANYPTLKANYPASTGSSTMVRDVFNGRPYVRTVPNTNYIYNQAFVNVNLDTRYYKSFQTTWITNTNGTVTPRGTLINGVDTAIWMPPFEVTSAKAAAFKGIILTPKGDLDNDGDIDGNAYTNVFFPSIKKFNDPTRAHMNDPSHRPLIIFRFAEVYLIAAEARIKAGGAGDADIAANHINQIRRRAAYNTGSANNTANMAAMEITGTDVTIDFILDERTREFYAEGLRWMDLVRTQKLLERVNTWNTEASAFIDDHHQLRPIPVAAQIDLLSNKDEFPNNPEY